MTGTQPSQCPGTAGYGSHCPSLHPQYSNIPATSHFGPRYCHTHLEPLCRSSTLGARCSRDPAWGGWVSEVGVGVEAWLEDWGWQVLGAVSLGTCRQKSVEEHSVPSWGQTPQGWWGRHTGRNLRHFHTVQSHTHPVVSHTRSHPRSDVRPVRLHSLGHRRTGRSQVGSGTRRGHRKRTGSGTHPHPGTRPLAWADSQGRRLACSGRNQGCSHSAALHKLQSRILGTHPHHHRCPQGQGGNQGRSPAHSGRSPGNFHSAETRTGQVPVHDIRQCQGRRRDLGQPGVQEDRRTRRSRQCWCRCRSDKGPPRCTRPRPDKKLREVQAGSQGHRYRQRSHQC